VKQPPRFAIVGPRRVRQGLGPFLARFLEQAGARVAAFACREAASVPAAQAELQKILGRVVAGHGSVAELIEARGAQLDALVIASPGDTHGQVLRAALEARLHVLCEKPFVWGEGAAAAESLVRGFAAAGRHLVVNTQWPWTLPAYQALFPERQPAASRSFVMALTPSLAGAPMIPDSMPHPLSLLQAVWPDPEARLEDIVVDARAPGGAALDVGFVYRALGRTIDCQVELRQGHTQPRRAAYGFDGRIAERVVRMADYAWSFTAEGREVPVPDPLAALVTEFVARVRGDAAPVADFRIAQGVAMLEQLSARVG
jgi:hypothetical protein